MVDDHAAASLPDNIPYDDKLQDTDLAYLFSSEAAQRSLAENYVGLPFDHPVQFSSWPGFVPAIHVFLARKQQGRGCPAQGRA